VQFEKIKLNQERKRKTSGLLQANSDRPLSAPRRAAKEDAAVLIGGNPDAGNAAANDGQFGESDMSG